EELKAGVRQRFRAAMEIFGQQLWQNPNLQANCFLLSEAVAWVAAADSTLGRLTWLRRQTQAAASEPKLEIGRRALARCFTETRRRLQRFDGELTQLRRGHYAPAVRAASLLFGQASEAAPVFRPLSVIKRPLSVLVVLEPPTPGVPQPRVEQGRLLE